MKQLYKVTLNHSGELHTLHTSTHSPERALKNAVIQLSKRLKLNAGFLLQKFTDKPNYTITEE